MLGRTAEGKSCLESGSSWAYRGGNSGSSGSQHVTAQRTARFASENRQSTKTAYD